MLGSNSRTVVWWLQQTTRDDATVESRDSSRRDVELDSGVVSDGAGLAGSRRGLLHINLIRLDINVLCTWDDSTTEIARYIRQVANVFKKGRIQCDKAGLKAHRWRPRWLGREGGAMNGKCTPYPAAGDHDL